MLQEYLYQTLEEQIGKWSWALNKEGCFLYKYIN